MICSECKKNTAIIFINSTDKDGKESLKGLCFDCAKKKGIDRFSNEDLRKINERLQLEDTYKRLSAAQMKKSESWVKQSIQKAAEGAVTDFTKGVFLGSAKLLVKNISPEFSEVAFSLKDKPQTEKKNK